MSGITQRRRAVLANDLAEMLDSRFFKALCEPGRIEILKLLIARGRSDIGTIAEHLPQDRSVISRHLAVLEEAGVLCSEKVARHRYYEVDSRRFIERMRDIVDEAERVIPVCCERTKG